MSRALLAAGLLAVLTLGGSPTSLAGEADSIEAISLFERFCFECHAGDFPEADLHLQRMASERAFAVGFEDWEKVVAMLDGGKMPPEDMPQPAPKQRRHLISWIRAELKQAAAQEAGDPGQVIMRRLTSAEYAYAVKDLTGLDLNLERDLAGDAVGGEGFSNIGMVQFIQDSTLERYLEAAKRVADHAVIGAGPIQFYRDPGQTGRELSAIHRIQEIYRAHGFRTAAGEGGEPFGLDRYPKAFYAAWRYHHRQRLGLGDVTLAALAAEEHLDARFLEHIWQVLTSAAPSYPTAEIVSQWHNLPAPTASNVTNATQSAPSSAADANTDGDLKADGDARSTQRPLGDLERQVRTACDDLYDLLRDWQGRLAEASGDREEASVLTESSIQIADAHDFQARIQWEEDSDQAKLNLSIVSADPQQSVHPVLIWHHPRLRFRQPNRRWGDERPLAEVLDEASSQALQFGRHPAGETISADDFVTVGTRVHSLTLSVPAGARQAELLVNVRLDLQHSEDCVVRCTISDGLNAARSKAISTLVANPAGRAFEDWKVGVIEFARLLPEVSHREPAPSDRDPIPPPFDNTYNNPERNDFHYTIKYHRDDRFLVENMLDDAARRRLDQAWTDLLTSFEYHDRFLRFVAEKYELDIDARGIAHLDEASMEQIPAEPRVYVQRMREEYASMQQSLLEAEAGHLADALQFASRAWRRPLSAADRDRLLGYYESLRKHEEIEHRQALRTLLTRILVAPEFLYRAERPAGEAGSVPLSDWELATRLSFFLWSSVPDDELRQAAADGRLHAPQQLAEQARRMLRDPKARRLATEFFGQWFGFYQFDRYRGVDPQRFPEFTEPLQVAMYEEAVAFFEYIVRSDRPVSEILFADYAFVNGDLAEHYAMERELTSSTPVRVDNVTRFHRGGLLGLGAVLTVTSAPLRTSPVKRGDWILRRILGTSVPPPPADAGSIPADDVLGDGLSVRERLELHRRDPSCSNCHSRFDAFGFALENFDPLGRWRSQYRNGDLIENAGTLDDETRITGINGLRDYLQKHEQRFQRTLCGKLIGYALGRGVMASDSALIERMLAGLQSNEATISRLVVEIVTSPQFRYHRGTGEPAPDATSAPARVDDGSNADPEPRARGES